MPNNPDPTAPTARPIYTLPQLRTLKTITPTDDVLMHRLLDTAIAALAQPAAPAPAETGREWRHLKTGGVYTEVGRADLQASDLISEGHRLLIYRGQDGRLWARPVAEFLDGRFVRHADVIVRDAQAQAGGENPPFAAPKTADGTATYHRNEQVCRLCGGTGGLHWPGCVALASGGEG